MPTEISKLELTPHIQLKESHKRTNRHNTNSQKRKEAIFPSPLSLSHLPRLPIYFMFLCLCVCVCVHIEMYIYFSSSLNSHFHCLPPGLRHCLQSALPNPRPIFTILRVTFEWVGPSTFFISVFIRRYFFCIWGVTARVPPRPLATQNNKRNGM